MLGTYVKVYVLVAIICNLAGATFFFLHDVCPTWAHACTPFIINNSRIELDANWVDCRKKSFSLVTAPPDIKDSRFVS